MPGATNNTDMLAGINQAIVALNEAVSAINSLTLEVTNNLPPLEVTNNLPPLEVTNDVDVNFDTASIVTELANLVTELNNIGVDTDQLTGLAEIANLVTEAQNSQTSLDGIRDRLAPSGDTIATAIRESKAAVTKIVDLEVTYGTPDAQKCTNSKALIGFISEDLRLKKEKMDFQISAGIATADLIREIISGTGFGTIEPFGLIEAVGGGLVSLGSVWGDITTADFATMIGDFEANKEVFLCDVYGCPTPADTLAAFRSRIAENFNPIDTVWVGMEETFVAASDMLARVFSNEITADEITRYTGWTGSDCSSCLGGPCPNDAWIKGTPAMYTTVWTLDTLTRVTAHEPQPSTPDIHWESNTARGYTLHAITDGAVIDVSNRDCDGLNTPDGLRFNLTNANLPITFGVCNQGRISGLDSTEWADITILS